VIVRIRHVSDAIKIEHTIFALPFAYVGMLLAARGWPGVGVAFWTTLALLGARTMAMALNRVIDRTIDARNPRTAGRHLPRGMLLPRDLVAAAMVGAILLFVSASRLNLLCLELAPLAVIFLVGYHYTKRFTWLSHWILGFTDGMAGAGGWLAVRGRFDPPALLLWFALTVWIGGFDLIYACQDVDFDRREGLQSVPARFGVQTALIAARVCHVLTVAALCAIPLFVPLGWAYWLGVLAVAGLFVYEHSLVSPADLSRLNVAFFNVNGYISVVVLVAAVAGLWR